MIFEILSGDYYSYPKNSCLGKNGRLKLVILKMKFSYFYFTNKIYGTPNLLDVEFLDQTSGQCFEFIN